MSYGLQIFKANGALGFSSDEVTWNQIDLLYCPGNTATYRYYPALVGREGLGVQILISPPPLNRKAIAHNVTISGGNVSVSGGSENAYILVLMR